MRILRPSFVLALLLLAIEASADEKPTIEAPADAAAAFEEGVRAFDANDFVGAASAFERAWAAQHHHAASWNAARSHHRAGDYPAAANLYARYLREAPAGAKDRDRALSALGALSTLLGRIEVHATADVTDVQVDGRTIENAEVWVNTGEHVVEGKTVRGAARKTIRVAAGSSSSVTLEMPPVLAPPGKESERRSRVPVYVFVSSAVATAVASGVTVWSGLDTVDQKRRFDETGTQEDLDDGRARQTRTNVLLAATVGLAIVAGVTALFVPWSSKGKGAVAFDFARPFAGAF